jgi:hypothetical protein
MRFGIRNDRNLYRAGTLRQTANELAKRKLDLGAFQDVRGVRVVVSQQTIIYLSMAMGMLIIS